ncbi:SIR2 family NAD-dependent protein deacylase [Paraclostridium tenue]
MNPHAIITTNYDILIENIFSDKYRTVIGQQVIRKSEVNKIGQIFKIHGCVTNPEEIIISSNDYDFFKKKQKHLSAKLLTYFIRHSTVFIGYSISDENIIGILRNIADMICIDDNLVENIWLVDWAKDETGEGGRPPSDKVINLGHNKTIRVNYIRVNDYIELFKTLH